jgi:hypothetical protein
MVCQRYFVTKLGYAVSTFDRCAPLMWVGMHRSVHCFVIPRRAFLFPSGNMYLSVRVRGAPLVTEYCVMMPPRPQVVPRAVVLYGARPPHHRAGVQIPASRDVAWTQGEANVASLGYRLARCPVPAADSDQHNQRVRVAVTVRGSRWGHGRGSESASGLGCLYWHHQHALAQRQGLSDPSI